MKTVYNIKNSLEPYLDSVVITLKKKFPGIDFRKRIITAGFDGSAFFDDYIVFFDIRIKTGWFSSTKLLKGSVELPYFSSKNKKAKVEIKIPNTEYKQEILKIYSDYLKMAVLNSVTNQGYIAEMKTTS